MSRKHDQINKTLDKAFGYTSDIMREMWDVYGEKDQPYFLHIMLLQCAHGLHRFGFEPSDIQQLINDEMGSK